MKKLIAPLTALALGLASISAFAANTPAKEGTSVSKPVKKSHQNVKKHRSGTKQHKTNQAAPAATK